MQVSFLNVLQELGSLLSPVGRDLNGGVWSVTISVLGSGVLASWHVGS